MVEATKVATGGQSWNSYPAFTPDGRCFIADDSGKSLKFYKAPSLEFIRSLPGFDPAFSTNGNALVYASGRRILRRVLPESENAAETILGELSSPVATLALSPNGNTVACTGEQDEGVGLYFWDLPRRRRV